MRGNKGKRIGYRQVFIILCMVFWIVFPFITRLNVIKVPDIEAKYFSTSNGYIVDLLLYCKEIVLAVFVGVVLLYFLGERIFPDNVIKIDRGRLKNLAFPMILGGAYLVLSVLSFLFSSFKETVFWGVNSEYEGLLAIIGYIGVFVFAVYYFKAPGEKEKGLDPAVILKCGIHILCLIIGILSLIEIFYKPILEITFVQDLISSEKYRELAHSIKNENFIGQICLTFNNPGFLGGFCAMFIPVNFCLLQEGKKIWKILGIAGTGMMGLTIVWSNSKVAVVSLFLTIPLSVFLLWFKNRSKDKKDRRGIKELLINSLLVVVIAVILVLMSKYWIPTYSSRVRPEGTESQENISGDSVYKLTKAELINGEVYFYSGEKLLKISVDQQKYQEDCVGSGKIDYSDCLVFSDGKELIEGRAPATLKETNIRAQQEGFKLEDERYDPIKICVQKELVIIDLGYSGTVEFYITEDGLKIFGQGSALHSEIQQPLVTGLEKFYSLFTGRGYIWVQSLPILKDSLLLGGGNGTFAFRFKQNEIVGLLNTHGSCKYVMDRPHNWYLQIACSAGIPALICVLTLFIWYLAVFIKHYKVSINTIGNKKGSSASEINSISALDIALFTGIIGFLLCGIINDSCVTVNPWFWMLFGIAVARRK